MIPRHEKDDPLNGDWLIRTLAAITIIFSVTTAHVLLSHLVIAEMATWVPLPYLLFVALVTLPTLGLYVLAGYSVQSVFVSWRLHVMVLLWGAGVLFAMHIPAWTFGDTENPHAHFWFQAGVISLGLVIGSLARLRLLK